MLNFRINKASFDRTMRGLLQIRKSAAPLSLRLTLNDVAYATAARAHGNIQKNFTLRNKWTQRGLVVEHAKQRNIADMKAVVGHRAEYMLVQEDGGIVRGKKTYKPIPTKQARIGRNIKKMVRSSYRLRNLNTKGKEFFIAKPRGRLGLFKRVGKRVVMLWDLSHRQVQIRKNPWLEPAVQEVVRRNDFEKAFFSNATKVFRRYGF